MTFEAPLFLAGLAVLPIAAALYARSERRSVRARRAFALPAVAASVVPRRAGWRRHLPAALLGLAAAALLFALARPEVTVAVAVEQATVVLVTDRSGSMAARDVAPSRLIAARRAADAFIDELPDEARVGAVVYNQAADVLAAPTRDHLGVREALAHVRSAGSTATGDALAIALRLALTPPRPGARRPPAAIVLLSDGKSVRGRDPLAVAREAKAADVTISTIALGTPQGTITVRGPDNTRRTERVPPDPVTLRQIARITGGRTATTADAAKLVEVYEELAEQVATEPRPRQLTTAFAGGAFALIAVAAAASLHWFGRVI
jgi:Ca-activated chloride channel family protein